MKDAEIGRALKRLRGEAPSGRVFETDGRGPIGEYQGLRRPTTDDGGHRWSEHGKQQTADGLGIYWGRRCLACKISELDFICLGADWHRPCAAASMELREHDIDPMTGNCMRCRVTREMMDDNIADAVCRAANVPDREPDFPVELVLANVKSAVSELLAKAGVEDRDGITDRMHEEIVPEATEKFRRVDPLAVVTKSYPYIAYYVGGDGHDGINRKCTRARFWKASDLVDAVRALLELNIVVGRPLLWRIKPEVEFDRYKGWRCYMRFVQIPKEPPDVIQRNLDHNSFSPCDCGDCREKALREHYAKLTNEAAAKARLHEADEAGLVRAEGDWKLFPPLPSQWPEVFAQSERNMVRWKEVGDFTDWVKQEMLRVTGLTDEDDGA